MFGELPWWKLFSRKQKWDCSPREILNIWAPRRTEHNQNANRGTRQFTRGTHEDWISNIVDALTDDKYLEKMMVFFKEYAEERECETAYTKDYDWPFKLTD